MRKKQYLALICILLIWVIFFFFAKAYSQEESLQPQPKKEWLDELRADEGLSEELKKELLDILKEDESEGGEEESAEIQSMEDKDHTIIEPEPFTKLEEEEEILNKDDPEDVEEEGVEFSFVEDKTPMEEPPFPEGDVEESNEIGFGNEITTYKKEEPKTKNNPSPQSVRISLDLKGVDIIDVLKMISARSGLNIVAGRNVRGTVTLFLKDVDVWDAFEIILAANDLAYVKEGDIINVITERDYEQLYGDRHYNKKELQIYKLEYAKASDVIKALNQAKSKIGKIIVDEGSNTIAIIDSPQAIAQMEKMIEKMDMPVETKVFGLDYAKAEDVKTKISEILTKGVGTIQVDERTNKVVITDLSKRMPEITKVIEEMDEKHKEVLIEAKIVQVELNDQYQYGVDWKAVFNKYPSTDGVRFNFDNITDSVFSGTATGGALTLVQFAHSYLNVAIEAIQTVGKTNVISCPRITVLNNEEAKVLVGTNQPYVTTTTTAVGETPVTSQQVTYIDVGVQLTVTPTINREGYVTMKIKPKVSSLGSPFTAGGNSFPVVSTSETETTVMVKDGNTILIAGLIKDRDEVTENKFPILGDIPILGNLFKSKTVGSTTVPEKSELVVFLTPYIVQGTEVFPEAENVWYGKSVTQRELLEQQMSLAVEDLKRKRSLFTKELPPPAEAAELVAKKEVVIPPTGLIPPSISRYYSYYEMLRNRIYWFAKDYYPKELKGKIEDVQLLFTLTRNGNLKGKPRVLNEVDEKLAEAAITAVEKAAPFPPFPEKIDKDQESFRVVLTYQ